jgi:hypothetical protein
MAYARLAAPVAPSLVLAGILVASNARTFAVRAAIALSLEAYFAFAQGPKGRGVMAERAALIAAARPYLEGARRIAAVDVGWPSAASDHDVVDLAGLTDLEIAALAGGHTSKRVDPAILLGRDPDVLLLYARGDHLAAHLEAWAGASYRGVVETRFARSEVIQRAFTPRAFLPLGTRGEGYVVLARRR